MVKTALNSGFGLFLIGVGLFFSSSGLINFIRPLHEDLQGTLTSGALLFKLGLILTGVLIILLGRIFISYTARHTASPEKHGRIEWVILFIVLCVAALLRIYRLNEGLWLDEILTQVNYTKASFGEIFTTYDSQNQHFLYSLLSHGSYLLFGESAWALRFPAVLFGLASIWALYKFSTEVSSKREALLSCALFTFSYHHIWFSQNARGYTGLLLFALLTSWMLIKGFNENRPRHWVVYGIVSALGAYTHLTMVIIVFSHFIIYILHLYRYRREDRDNRWMPMVGFFLAGILTFQLYAFVLPQMLGGTLSQGSIVASWKNPLWTLLEFVKGIKIGLKGLVPGILGLGIFIAGLWDFVRRKSIVIEMLFIPTFIVAFITIAMGHHLWPRLFFFSFGFVVLILARGCMQFGAMVTQMLKFEQKKSTLFGTAIFCIILFASAVSVPSAYGPKQDYLGALSFVERNREKADVVFSVGSARFVYEKFYKANWDGVERAEDIESILKSPKRVWLIYTLPFHLETVYPDIMGLIRRQFLVVEKYYGTLNGGEIYVCRNKE
jgi:hypothetical protein